MYTCKKTSVISILMLELKYRLKSLIYILVGSLASEFLGWSWKSYIGIPMLDIGIPTLEFQCPT